MVGVEVKIGRSKLEIPSPAATFVSLCTYLNEAPLDSIIHVANIHRPVLAFDGDVACIVHFSRENKNNSKKGQRLLTPKAKLEGVF